MKITPAQAEAFVADPKPGVRAILVYGPDSGRVRELTRLCLRRARSDSVSVVDGAVVSGEPAKLMDLVLGRGLFAEQAPIRLREATDKCTAAIKQVFEAPIAGNLLIVEAGGLEAKSSLRQLFEKSDAGAAIPCYEPEAADLSALAARLLSAAGKTVAKDALTQLGQTLPHDRAAAGREIEKLILYLGDATACTMADVEACIEDASEHQADHAALAAADRLPRETALSTARLLAAGVSAVAILRAGQRHFQRLMAARAEIDAGASPGEAIDGLRPPVFFKEKPRIERQVSQWDSLRIERALGRLTEAEQLCKRTGYPEDTVTAWCLCEIARTAR